MSPRDATLPLALCLALLAAESALAAEHTVCPDGSCDFTTIGAAVTAAASGDTVWLVGGNVYEENVTVTKDLHIESQTVASYISPSSGYALMVSGATVTVGFVGFDGQYLSAGLYVDSTGSLTVATTDLFYHRSTTSGAAAVVEGGGYLALSDFVVYSAETLGTTGSRADGGGIHAQAGATVELKDGTIQGCLAGSGGAILLDGASLDLDTVNFTTNGVDWGGAAILANEGSEITAVDTTFAYGFANSASGGAILANDSDVSLEDSLFSANIGSSGGGSIQFLDTTDDGAGSALVVVGCLFDGVAGLANASGGGGAIDWKGDHAESTLTVIDTVFSDNETTLGNGGAIHATTDGAGAVTLTDNQFVTNIAGHIGFAGIGGAVVVENVDTLTATGNWYERNSAGDSAAGLYVVEVGVVELDGDVYYRNSSLALGGGSGVDAVDIDVLDVVDCTFEGNVSQDGGAGLRATSVGELTVDQCTFDANAGDGYGMALQALEVDTVAVTSSVFVYASGDSDSWGPALDAYQSGDVTVTDSWFLSNYATNGSAIWAFDLDSFAMRRNVVEGNVAYNGPTTYLSSVVDSSITHNAFLNNTAYDYPAALNVRNGTTTEIANNLFLGNTTCIGSAVVGVYETDLVAVNNVIWHGQQGRGSDKRTDEIAECVENTGLYARWDTAGATYQVDYNLSLGDGTHVDAEDLGVPITVGEHNLTDIDPEFQSYVLYGTWSESNLLPAIGSPLVDAGDPTRSDPDGSTSDIGMYGGSEAWDWMYADDDGDDWMWMWDCNDRAEVSFPDAPELCDGQDNDCDGVVDDGVDEDLDEDGHTACEGDCAPLDELVYPGADELCDGLIFDCDLDALPVDEVDVDGDDYVACILDGAAWGDLLGGGDCDEGDPTLNPDTSWYADDDGDGYGDDTDSLTQCAEPAGYVRDDRDCDDADPTEHPGAIWYEDSDGDGFGDADSTTTRCRKPAGHVADDTDCDDGEGTVYPGAPELCDGLANDCGDALRDVEIDDDEDGYVECSLDVVAWDGIDGGDDCDDEAGTVYPGADAACDGIANDCDADGPTLDEQDLDGDTFVECSYDGATWAGDDAVTGGSDCEPLEGTVYPGATELCDGQINDCDTSTLPADESDTDGDGAVACTFDSGGWDGADAVWTDGDCEDGDASVFPGAPELCDGLMNDCDADAVPADETDDDEDGYVECVLDVDPWTGITGGEDCDDDAVGVNPGATEVCDAADVDEDCDGLADDADASAVGGTASYPDFDGDGYGNEDATAVEFCDPPVDWVADHTDCDDMDDGAYPGATEEAYDFVDQDCDGADLCDVDEDGFDSDACLGDDCDDTDAATYPEADDAWYDGVDSNCDGANDYDQDGDGYASEDHGGEDCDDTDATTFPGAADEPKDDIDQDCDGEDAKKGCSSVPVAPSGVLALIGLLGAAVRRRR